MKFQAICTGLLAYLFISSSAARADLIFYSDPASFQAASTNLQTVGFNGILSSPTDFKAFPTPLGITLSGVNFNIGNALPGDTINVTGRDYYNSTKYPNDFLVQGFDPSRSGTNLVITFPAGFTAISIDLGTFNGTSLLLTLSSGDKFSFTPLAFGGLSFLGFTSTIPITSLTIFGSGSEAIVLDNVQFGAAAVPEPSTLTILGLSSIALFALWRRRLA
jgi:hypothetical protein